MQKDPSFPDAVSGDDVLVEPTAEEKAAFFPAVHGDRPPTKSPAPPETASPGKPPRPAPTLDELLKQVRAAAKRGPGRPRRSTGASLPPALAEIALMTPEQREARLAKITEKLHAAEQEADELEQARGDVDPLDDAALDRHHADLARAKERATTLTAVHERFQRDMEQVAERERETEFEAWARREQARHVPAHAEAMQQMFAHMQAIVELGAQLDESQRGMDHANYEARNRDRPDLRFDPGTLRSALNREFGAPAPNAAPIEHPERMGESEEAWTTRILHTLAGRAGGRYQPDWNDSAKGGSKAPVIAARLRDARQMYVEPDDGEDDDAYLKRLWASVAQYLNCHRAESEPEADYAVRLREALARKMKLTRKAESDEAYRLRVANAHGLRQRAVERADPLHVTAGAAVEVLNKHCPSEDLKSKVRHDQRMRREAEYGDRFGRSPLDGVGVRNDYDESKGVARLPGQ